MRKRIATWVVATAKQAAWAPLFVFTLHVVLANGFGVYLLHPLFDIPMHFAGGVAISFFLLRACRNATSAGFMGQPNDLTLFLLSFALTCGAAVFWEFAEFLVDQCFGSRAQLGLEDTLCDMFCGITGGLTFLAVAATKLYRSPRVCDEKTGDRIQ